VSVELDNVTVTMSICLDIVYIPMMW